MEYGPGGRFHFREDRCPFTLKQKPANGGGAVQTGGLTPGGYAGGFCGGRGERTTRFDPIND